MQKFVNVLAIASATVSLAVVSGGIYLYTQKDAIIQGATEKAIESIGLGGIAGSLPTECLAPAVPVPDMEAPQAAPMESPF